MNPPFGTLKDALKSTSNSGTATSTSSSTGASSLSNDEASSGLKEALMQGVGEAVGTLRTADGFLEIEKSKYPCQNRYKKLKKHETDGHG